MDAWCFLPDGHVAQIGETLHLSWGACSRAIDALTDAPGARICRMRMKQDSAGLILWSAGVILWVADATEALWAFVRWCADHWDVPDIVRLCIETKKGDVWEVAYTTAHAAANDAANAVAWAIAYAYASDGVSAAVMDSTYAAIRERQNNYLEEMLWTLAQTI